MNEQSMLDPSNSS